MRFWSGRNSSDSDLAIMIYKIISSVWLILLVLQWKCASGGGPLQDPKHWRRPVPGWRQSPESLALENQGFGFEEAEFEVHFSEKGKTIVESRGRS